ncbi:MAG: aspartyl/glutamyl-tRNA amidotransferase subunit C [Legionellaceae bacterium]|nr:aspartyl/glutamyl-tRNA amidotransferase subunit C [Legionellaceae bacterium]
MTINSNTVKKIASLAYIEQDDAEYLLSRISNTLQEISKLEQIDTTNTSPCTHPSASSQYLRPDTVINDNNIKAFADIAPLFEKDNFLVPNILKKGE